MNEWYPEDDANNINLLLVVMLLTACDVDGVSIGVVSAA